MSYLIGVSGGSGSGKTTFGREVQKLLGFDRCNIIYQDSYYIDQSDDFDGDGGAINFDHPSSLDFQRMVKDLTQIKQGKTVHVPIYDFATHKRQKETRLVQARDVTIIDGILIYTQPSLVELLDETVFINTPEHVRFERRLKRDVEERGRTPEGVRAQFENHVKPMHDKFVEPSQKTATLVLDGVGDYKMQAKELADQVFRKIRSV